ncbi:MAG: DNA mismatch repair endonuclease MutL [Anaerolineae bacterium]|nr:DNA mismatch repair endonuclease MutL [Anaerolineae bacterium]MBL8106228.1 DNA mismatch repair endonuclease MutL [Anaerolineales bacterium]MCC7188614.1 DNA mismatch repair endonuclease MutL [Anaerolineales bacterium]
MPIRMLSPEVASQIAAGEVIERPASVVKELLENSLDAGANTIAIHVEEAGKKRIEIADDGAGIPADELELAASRHATSKLVRSDELFSIVTLGFRGEALASIGSVSRMTITSRVGGEKEGARFMVEGGKSKKPTKVGATVGTVICVEDLFYNVPARLKFLKTDTTERRAIDTLVARYALAYPAKRFKLTDGKNVVLQTAGDGDRRAILAALYGVDVAKQMLEVHSMEEGMTLAGFISPTSLTRSNRKEITFFINGRWVHEVALSTALMQAYHTLLMVGRYPLAALFLEIKPEDVDVNVHPAKAEVRFRNQDKVFSFVQRSARKALLAYSPVPNVAPSLWGGRSVSVESNSVGLDWTIGHDNQVNSDQLSVNGDLMLRQAQHGEPETDAQSPTSNLHSPNSQVQSSSFARIPLLRLIGQIGAAYLVAEGPDGLYLIDQHAAHERVLFEKLMAQREMKSIASQALLTPVAVTLPPQSTQLLMSQLPVLKYFGFDVEEFGPNTFQIRAMPVLFSGSDPSAALRALVEDFEEDEAPLKDEVEKKLAARVCKRMAVRAGMSLSNEEQRALLADLETCDSPRTCPHGRPTMIHLSVDVLERQFGRRGAR